MQLHQLNRLIILSKCIYYEVAMTQNTCIQRLTNNINKIMYCILYI